MSSSPLPKGKELAQRLVLAELLKRRGEEGPLARPRFVRLRPKRPSKPSHE